MEVFQDIWNDHEFSRFGYFLLISGTALILLFLLSGQGFPVPFSIVVFLAWFVLVIMFPIPEKAKSEVIPFDKKLVDS